MTTSFKNDQGTGFVEADGFGDSAFEVIAAAGSNSQAGSTLISKRIAVVTTVATSTRGVRLPAPAANEQGQYGAYYEVYNATAKTMNVYPATGGNVGTAATNAAATLAANKGARYWAQSATQWRVVGP